MPAPRDDRTIYAPEWLRSALSERARSAAWLARALEVDTTTVSRWSTGKTVITRMTWLAVLAVLGLPPDWRPSAPAEPSTPKRRPR